MIRDNRQRNVVHLRYMSASASSRRSMKEECYSILALQSRADHLFETVKGCIARSVMIKCLWPFAVSVADCWGGRFEGKAFYRYDTHHLMFSYDVLLHYS